MTTRLEQLNPAMKALTSIVCILLLAVFFDPLTPLLYLLWTIGITAWLADIHWRKWLFLAPFLVFAFGYFWTTALFAQPANSTAPVWEWGWMHIYEEGLYKGLSLALRTLAFASLSFAFVFTTEPVHFIYSLMRQWRLPPRLAYGVLAGFRLLPTFLDEIALIRKAHRIRGVDRVGGLIPRIMRLGRYLIPLLAGAIRKAERAAMAMESKGFTGSRDRTFYYTMRITYRDWLYLFLMLGGLALSAAISWKTGMLGIYRKEL